MNDWLEYKAAFEQNDLAHYGIPGMRWGVRRYQNPDGTLTAEGKRRKNEEIDAVNVHYDKQKNYQKKKISKINKYFEEGKRSEAKDEKMKKRLKKHEEFYKAYDQLAKDEIKKIKNTPIKDLINYRSTKRGKAIAKTILVNGLSVLALHTLGVGVFGIPRKDNNFLTEQERINAIQKSGGNFSNRELNVILRVGSTRGINRRSKKHSK